MFPERKRAFSTFSALYSPSSERKDSAFSLHKTRSSMDLGGYFLTEEEEEATEHVSLEDRREKLQRSIRTLCLEIDTLSTDVNAVVLSKTRGEKTGSGPSGTRERVIRLDRGSSRGTRISSSVETEDRKDPFITHYISVANIVSNLQQVLRITVPEYQGSEGTIRDSIPPATCEDSSDWFEVVEALRRTRSSSPCSPLQTSEMMLSSQKVPNSKSPRTSSQFSPADIHNCLRSRWEVLLELTRALCDDIAALSLDEIQGLDKTVHQNIIYRKTAVSASVLLRFFAYSLPYVMEYSSQRKEAAEITFGDFAIRNLCQSLFLHASTNSLEQEVVSSSTPADSNTSRLGSSHQSSNPCEDENQHQMSIIEWWDTVSDSLAVTKSIIRQLDQR